MTPIDDVPSTVHLSYSFHPFHPFHQTIPPVPTSTTKVTKSRSKRDNSQARWTLIQWDPTPKESPFFGQKYFEVVKEGPFPEYPEIPPAI